MNLYKGQIPALSIRQPWAELIILGRKTIEIRHWPTDYRGQLWLHTGRTADTELEKAYGFSDLFHGGFVGYATLEDVVPFDEKRWMQWKSLHLDQGEYRPGDYAWMLSNATRFKKPIVAPGERQLFLPSTEINEVLEKARLDS